MGNADVVLASKGNGSVHPRMVVLVEHTPGGVEPCVPPPLNCLLPLCLEHDSTVDKPRWSAVEVVDRHSNVRTQLSAPVREVLHLGQAALGEEVDDR